jgi:hypothetical protein
LIHFLRSETNFATLTKIYVAKKLPPANLIFL